MAVSAQQAVYEVLFQYLNGASPLWGQRVQPLSTASSDLDKPYLVFFLASNINEDATPSRDNQRFVISVKGVAAELNEAMAMQAAMSALLRNSGRQDINPRLPIHADWDILTVTQDRVIWIQEKPQTGNDIYHAGYQYEIFVEAK